ncbi:hypothetical protein L208DRAFT_1304846 [Tricholoma matsutake]|nr:hypothetical protein L208DRAFT_1304846 [Tricholoma matsutake 945]
MARVEILTLSSLPSLLISPHSLYLVGYAWLFGMSLWVSFFGGVFAHKALPREHFLNLQHKIFPIYFVISVILSASLLVLWTFSHPDVMTHITRPNVADVAQAYVLVIPLFCQSLNYFVIGPLTSKTMFRRHRLEKEEGKTYNEPGVSAEMQGLNRRFGMLHGVSSLANLGAVIALGFHGLWIGHAGVKGY